MLVYISFPSILFSPYLLLLLVHLVKLVLFALLVKIKLSPRSLASTGSTRSSLCVLTISYSIRYSLIFPFSPTSIHPPIHFLKKLRFPNSKTQNSVYRQVQRYARKTVRNNKIEKIKKKFKKRVNIFQFFLFNQ